MKNRNFSNVQSPGSTTSKGGKISGFNDYYLPTTLNLSNFLNFDTNNYGNHYVADENATSSSNDFDFNDIDEIDTNNMEIYNGKNATKDRTGADIFGKDSDSNFLQHPMKQEPKEAVFVTKKIPEKSLLNNQSIKNEKVQEMMINDSNTSAAANADVLDPLIAQTLSFDDDTIIGVS
jgi:hypothetical protein